ncbi:MAG TPA: tRNA (adenosine(37)-N6)-dimethylallyltransferase MiaA [Parasegetibacter sp.]
MKQCIIIAGPTAVGKTNEAIDLARFLNTSIISADSRQCYKELNIGVAKPTPGQLNTVRHYFIHSHSIHQEINAANYEQYALNAASEIFSENDYAVMVGGTGLYIKAFAEGLDEMPEIDPEIRQSLRDQYINNGIDWLRQQVAENDLEYFEKGENQNPHRLLRALEVVLSTGKSILSFRQTNKTVRAFEIIKVGLELPRQELYARINQRVDKMMEDGLLEEVRTLLPFQHLNALQTVGYRELFSYFKGELSLDEAVEKIKTNTRQYAKRQLTWFKRDPSIKWLSPGQTTEYFRNLLNESR